MTYARSDLQHIITYLRSIGAPQGYIDNANNAIKDITEVFQNKRDLEASFDALEVKNKRLRAALEVAHKYVLVQSCELSLMPDDAKRDLVIVDAALAEEKKDAQ